MRTIAVGDIHGCSRAFDTLLMLIEPQASDRLVTLGDYVDRGPDSSGIIDRLLALRRKLNLVCLRGNHDHMMLESRDNFQAREMWLEVGGRETLASYAILGDAGKLVDVPDTHWDFLENFCVDWYETEKHFFVHGNVYADLPLSDQPTYVLHYEKFNDPPPHCSGKVMICGHTAQRSGRPRNLGHAICIDTWVYGNGWLTGLDLSSGRVWQANQRGEHRAAWIDDFGVGDA